MILKKRQGFISEFTRRQSFRAERGGFTLLEILLVVGAIGILAGIVIATFRASSQRAPVYN